MPFALPPITSAADAVKASAAFVTAVADGELTPPPETAELGKLIETVLRGIEVTDVQDRLARPEATP